MHLIVHTIIIVIIIIIIIIIIMIMMMMMLTHSKTIPEITETEPQPVP